MSAPVPTPPHGGALVVDEAAPALPRQEEVLTEEALAFLGELHRRFTPRRDALLVRRAERRAEIARTARLDFLPETAAIRADDSWRWPRPRPRSRTAGWRSPGRRTGG